MNQNLHSQMDPTLYRQKREFAFKLAAVLTTAKPHLSCCYDVFTRGNRIFEKAEKYPDIVTDVRGGRLMEGDEYIVVFCQNGHKYFINVSGDSLMSMGEQLFKHMIGK